MAERETPRALLEKVLSNLSRNIPDVLGASMTTTEDLCSEMLRSLEQLGSPSATLQHCPDFCKVLSGLCSESDLLLDEKICKLLISCVIQFSGCIKVADFADGDERPDCGVNQRAALWGLGEMRILLQGKGSAIFTGHVSGELIKEMGLSAATVVGDVVPRLPLCLVEEALHHPSLVEGLGRGDSFLVSLDKADRCALKMGGLRRKLKWEDMSESVDRLCSKVRGHVHDKNDLGRETLLYKSCKSFLKCLSNHCQNPTCDLARAISSCCEVFTEIVNCVLCGTASLLDFADNLLTSGVAHAGACSVSLHTQLLERLRLMSRLDFKSDGQIDWQCIVMATTVNLTVASEFRALSSSSSLILRFPCELQSVVTLLAVSPGQLPSVMHTLTHFQTISELLFPGIFQIETQDHTQWTALHKQTLIHNCWILRQFSWWHDIAVAFSVNASERYSHICAVFICCFHYPHKLELWETVIGNIMALRKALLSTPLGQACLDKLSLPIGLQMIFLLCVKETVNPATVKDLSEAVLGRKLSNVGMQKLSMFIATRQRVFGPERCCAIALNVSFSSLLCFCDELVAFIKRSSAPGD